MNDFDHTRHSIGWIGAGRMGYAMAERLAKAGCDIAVYNRTRAKAEPLAEAEAMIVDTPALLAGRAGGWAAVTPMASCWPPTPGTPRRCAGPRGFSAAPPSSPPRSAATTMW